MRERYCKVCGGWHKLDAWPSNCMPERIWTRSDLGAPMVISDTMDPVQSMASGKMYDSKSAIRAEYKSLGLVEVGNDVKTTPKPIERPKKQEIRASVERAFSQAGFGA